MRWARIRVENHEVATTAPREIFTRNKIFDLVRIRGADPKVFNRNAGMSYGSAGGNDGTSWDHHDPVSNVIVVAVYVARFALGRYHNTVSDTDVFVYNGLFNNAMSSYAQGGKLRLGLRILVLVKIRAHQN